MKQRTTGGNIVSVKIAINLQDSYLNQVRKDNVLATVYLVNGFQLKGLVKAFDSYTVLLDVDGKQMLVYKHAISTINPARPVSMSVPKDKELNAAKANRDQPQD